MERTSICVACAYYGVGPLSLSVDPACRSEEEADRLCAVHRARCTEGYCVVCGRSEPRVSPWPRSRIGTCERCTRDLYGAAPAVPTPGAGGAPEITSPGRASRTSPPRSKCSGGW